MKKANFIAILFFFVFSFMLGVWQIDLSASCLFGSYELTKALCHTGRYVEGYATNGFWNFSCVQTYHLAMYLAIVSFAIAILMAIYAVHGGCYDKKN